MAIVVSMQTVYVKSKVNQDLDCIGKICKIANSGLEKKTLLN